MSLLSCYPKVNKNYAALVVAYSHLHNGLYDLLVGEGFSNLTRESADLQLTNSRLRASDMNKNRANSGEVNELKFH